MDHRRLSPARGTLLTLVVLLLGLAAPLDAQLTPKQQKTLDKLAAKHDAVSAKLVELQAALVVDELALADAQQALTDAKALPTGTPQEKKLAKKAVKKANKAVKKASKRVAKRTKKILKRQTKLDALVAAIEALDPDFFEPADPDDPGDPGDPLSAYAPTWGDVAPLRTLQLDHDAGLSDLANGAALQTAVHDLLPGDRLVVSAGTFAFDTPLLLDLAGDETAPIVVEGAEGTPPVLTRADVDEPLVEIGLVGGATDAEHLVLRGFELVGGEIAVNVHAAHDIWIDGCEMRDTGGGVRSGTDDVQALHITRNDIHDTVGWGEGVRLGNISPNWRTTDSVVALNHIYDTTAATQGDGVDIKRGSHSNWIAENEIHGTRYPCIYFYGTDGNPVNLIERNVCYDSLDNIIQAEEGEAIVRNNLLMDPAGNKLFDSTHNKETLRDLTVVHNTMLAGSGYGAGLWAWNGQPGLVFANNVVYVQQTSVNAYAVAYGSVHVGGTMSGNVIVGQALNVPTGYALGNGLGDLPGVSGWGYAFSGDVADFLPQAGGPAYGTADPAYAVDVDLLGNPRKGTLEAGCLDAP